jgi:hypothetical protein
MALNITLDFGSLVLALILLFVVRTLWSDHQYFIKNMHVLQAKIAKFERDIARIDSYAQLVDMAKAQVLGHESELEKDVEKVYTDREDEEQIIKNTRKAKSAPEEVSRLCNQDRTVPKAK